ncbi:hypothetical protein OV079_16450 [Nannocystis pusilla]|uniref:Uncharacterized protein n=1 Tax=Nannocystis pusilla TaxID=889268 RepID=A0A9X3EV75_9BACT|nr:hypothetical protein [Nannocystis pusilla]MCY1007116.1 hypothetical protein [Nannocystis pusilla]
MRPDDRLELPALLLHLASPSALRDHARNSTTATPISSAACSSDTPLAANSRQRASTRSASCSCQPQIVERASWRPSRA